MSVSLIFFVILIFLVYFLGQMFRDHVRLLGYILFLPFAACYVGLFYVAFTGAVPYEVRFDDTQSRYEEISDFYLFKERKKGTYDDFKHVIIEKSKKYDFYSVVLVWKWKKQRYAKIAPSAAHYMVLATFPDRDEAAELALHMAQRLNIPFMGLAL